jgi:cysteine desulfurase
MIYLDWNSTAPLSAAARAAWLTAQDSAWGNPGAVHALGQAARHAVDQARMSIAKLLGGAAHEWIVTSGGSEANALAITSALADGGSACCSAVEHSSVLRNVEAAATNCQRIAVDDQGRVTPAALTGACGNDTRLVCVQFANNETGVRQNLAELIPLIRKFAPQAWIHVDAAQGAGKTAINVRDIGADSVAIAGHKFGSPKGIGLLWVRAGRTIEPLVRGGRQQQDRRSGTEDAALVVALAAALQERCATMEAEAQRQRRLLDDCFAELSNRVPGVRWLGSDAERLANVMSLAYRGVAAESLVTRLDLAGCAVSRGAACMAVRGEPSHVIAALGIEPSLAMGTIRISIGWTTTAAELAQFVDAYALCIGTR